MTDNNQTIHPGAAVPPYARTGKLGLYIHLPFCRTKCSYCAFVSGPPRTEAEMDAYLEAVLAHLQLGAAEAKTLSVSTVFFGGGTPSLMGAQRLSKLFQTIRANYDLEDHCEITIETNPESASRELFDTLIPLGLNRVSLGAQSFHDDELKQIGRVHDSNQIKQAVEHVKHAGIENLSLDLIYGLPGQSLQRWNENLDAAIALGACHVSAYALAFEEGTLLNRLYETGKVAAIEDESYVEMHHSTRERLAQAGFSHYEISNWCFPGKECKHNIIYWNRDEYLAFGVSAHGWFAGRRFRITHRIPDYIDEMARIKDKKRMTYFDNASMLDAIDISREEAASDAMIFGLRLLQGIDINDFKARFGETPRQRWPKPIQESINNGNMILDDSFLRLAPGALMISNEILEGFI